MYLILCTIDYDDDEDDHYDYVSTAPDRNRNYNEAAPTTNQGIVDNPYYEGSDDIIEAENIQTANSPINGQGIETITVRENLYYEE